MFIFGLGNPGKKYLQTRHNLGFIVIDEIVQHYQSLNPLLIKKTLSKNSSEAVIIQVKGKKIFFIKPLTFMNASGQAVLKFMQEYKFSKEEMLIVYDDIYLPFGKLRFKIQNTSGGHRGVGHILDKVGGGLPCLKQGIANQKMRERNFALERYVLDNFTPGEKSQLPSYRKFSKDAIIFFIENGLERARQNFNNKSFIAQTS